MPTKFYTDPESPLSFNPANSSGSRQFTPQSLADGQGWMSDAYDFGSAAHCTLFRWRARTVLGGSATGVVTGAGVEVYLALADSDGFRDGNLGSGNQGLNDPEKRRNLQYVGSLVADKTTPLAGDALISSGLVEIKARQASVVFWNLTGQPLGAATGLHELLLVPVPDEFEN